LRFYSFQQTLSEVKLNNTLNWGEAIYHAPTKVYVPNSIPDEVITPPPALITEAVEAAVEEGVVEEPVVATTTTLEVVPVPGFVIRTAKLTESDKPVYINVFQHVDVVDEELKLSYATPERTSNETPATATTVETATQAQDYEKITPVVFSSAPSVVQLKDQEYALYNVLVSSAYFKVDPEAAEKGVNVTHPTSVSKVCLLYICVVCTICVFLVGISSKHKYCVVSGRMLRSTPCQHTADHYTNTHPAHLHPSRTCRSSKW